MSGLEIPVVQRLIDSLLLKQFLMGSFFGNPILCKYQYLLGILDRRQPVGDHEGPVLLPAPPGIFATTCSLSLSEPKSLHRRSVWAGS